MYIYIYIYTQIYTYMSMRSAAAEEMASKSHLRYRATGYHTPGLHNKIPALIIVHTLMIIIITIMINIIIIIIIVGPKTRVGRRWLNHTPGLHNKIPA